MFSKGYLVVGAVNKPVLTHTGNTKCCVKSGRMVKTPQCFSAAHEWTQAASYLPFRTPSACSTALWFEIHCNTLLEKQDQSCFGFMFEEDEIAHTVLKSDVTVCLGSPVEICFTQSSRGKKFRPLHSPALPFRKRYHFAWGAPPAELTENTSKPVLLLLVISQQAKMKNTKLVLAAKSDPV